MKRSDKIAILVIRVLVTSFGLLGWLLFRKTIKENDELVDDYNELVKKYNKLAIKHNDTLNKLNEATDLASDSLCDGMETQIKDMDLIKTLVDIIENEVKVDSETIQKLRDRIRITNGACYRLLRRMANEND